MSKQYIFIDDSGDAGLQNSNTDQLIVAAVIIVDENKKRYFGCVNQLNQESGF